MVRDGFTLVEVMVVVVILGFIAMLAVSNFSSSLNEKKVSGAADEIADALRHARSEAMKSGRNFRVDINTDTELIEIVDVDEAAVIRHPVSRQPYRIDLTTAALLKGVDIEAVNSATGLTPVIFDKYGRTSSDATIDLSSGGQAKHVHVDAVTGRVSTGP